MASSPGARQRGKRSRDSDSVGSSAEPPDVTALRTYVDKEDEKIRAKAKLVLNGQLISQTEAIAALEVRLEPIETYEQALESGIVDELRAELHKNFKMGSQLEIWLNTYAPPLASGGNTGISAEVQDGIYANVHHLTQCCGDGLHRMLAFEKEHAIVRTKCTDDAVWERYKAVLEDNQMHDLNKSAMSMRSDLLMIGNSICKNLDHLRTDMKEESVATMY